MGEAGFGSSARVRVAKPLLVRISHAIEAFALASDRDYPLAVVALFQRLAYFEREAELYARIGAHAALTVIGVVDPPTPTGAADSAYSPDGADSADTRAGPAASVSGAGVPGVVFVRLGEDSPLAREWSVVALSPRSGASLCAIDLQTLDPYARSLEGGRMFSAGWSFHRADAYAELVRLRTALAPGLSPARLRTVDDVLTQVVAVPGADRDDRTDAAVRLLVTDLYRAQRQRNRLAERIEGLDPHLADRDPRSGLPTAGFLSRWAGRSATGTLTVGLALIRLPELGQVRDQHGFRADLALTQSIGRLLRRSAAGPDRAVRVSENEFALLMPGRRVEHMLGVAEALQRGVRDFARGYPFVAVTASIAVTATSARPLPIEPLRAAADTAHRHQHAIVTL